MDPLSVKRRLSCILAADAVGYSQQMEQDEESTIRVLAAHRAVIDGIITFHGGRIISTAGDSVMAEFGSVVEAVRCAVEIQEALKTRNDALPDKSQMHFRVGVNLGDVVVRNDDLLGDGVNENDVPTLDHFPFHAPPHAGYLHSQENGTNGKGTVTGQ